jgi:hypothetical protein
MPRGQRHSPDFAVRRLPSSIRDEDGLAVSISVPADRQ